MTPEGASLQGTRIGTTAKRVFGIIAGTLSITAPTALAADTEANVDVATGGTELAGLAVGDQVDLQAPDDLELGLVLKSVKVQALNTLRCRFLNSRAVAGPATAARTYAFQWFDMTAE